jgi:hypothetical protein
MRLSWRIHLYPVGARAPRTIISFTTLECCEGRPNYNSALWRHLYARSTPTPSTAATPPKLDAISAR